MGTNHLLKRVSSSLDGGLELAALLLVTNKDVVGVGRDGMRRGQHGQHGQAEEGKGAAAGSSSSRTVLRFEKGWSPARDVWSHIHIWTG
jgi:hypothetical protein